MNTHHSHRDSSHPTHQHIRQTSSSFKERMAWLDSAQDQQALDELRSKLLTTDVDRVQQTIKRINTRFWEHAHHINNASVQRIKGSYQFAPKDAILNFFGLISENELWARWEAQQEKTLADTAKEEAQTEQLMAETTLWEVRLEKLQNLQAGANTTTH